MFTINKDMIMIGASVLMALGGIATSQYQKEKDAEMIGKIVAKELAKQGVKKVK